MQIAREERWIAAEDAGLYRDALGVVPPTGLPDSFVEKVDDALVELARRFARHHGPFLSRDIAARFDLRVAQVEPTLKLLEQRGVLVRGEIRPGGAELDWCDAEVLRRLKRRNLAELRDEVAAVDASAYALFMPQWHGIGDGRRGPERLKEVVAQLQDYPMPWSLLCERRAHLAVPSRAGGRSAARRRLRDRRRLRAGDTRSARVQRRVLCH